MCHGRLNHSPLVFTIRLTALLSSLLFSAPSLLAQEQPPETPFDAVVIEDKTPLRAGAAKTFYVVGELPAGSRVRVEEVFHGWYRIVSPKNVFSYVSKAHVDARGDGSQGQVNTDRAPVNAASINGVGESYRRQLDLAKGDAVRIVGEEGGFYKIIAPAKAFVFIAPGALKKSLPDQQPPALTPQPKPAPASNIPQPPPQPKPTATNTQQTAPLATPAPKPAPKPADTTPQTSIQNPIQKKSPSPAQPAPPTSIEEPAEEVEVESEISPPPPPPTVQINIREPAQSPAAANSTKVSPSQPKPADLSNPVKPTPQPPAPADDVSDTDQTIDDQTADGFEKPEPPTPSPEAISHSPSSPRTVLDEQSITQPIKTAPPQSEQPKQKIKPQYPTLIQAEARFKTALQLPLEEQPLSDLLLLYTNLSTHADLQPAEKQIVQTRLAQINRNIKLAHAVADLKRVKQEINSNDKAAFAADRAPTSNPPAYSTNYKYNSVGLLLTSRVYDGSSLPKLYRVVDPQGQRTIAYVQPASPSLDLAKFLGKIVGITGASRFDSTLTLNILDAQQIDVLEPSITKPAQ